MQKRQRAGERASLGDYKKWTLEKLVPKLCEILTDETEKGELAQRQSAPQPRGA